MLGLLIAGKRMFLISDMKKISLTKGFEAIIDDEDFDKVSRYRWYSDVKKRRVYAGRSERGDDGLPRSISMHRFILGHCGNLGVDHIDGNGLNNQKSNLRICTQTENLRAFQRKRHSATSKYRGVSWSSDRKKWLSQIVVNKKTINLGRYEDDMDAAKSYNIAAEKYFGAFATLNKI